MVFLMASGYISFDSVIVCFLLVLGVLGVRFLPIVSHILPLLGFLYWFSPVLLRGCIHILGFCTLSFTSCINQGTFFGCAFDEETICLYRRFGGACEPNVGEAPNRGNPEGGKAYVFEDWLVRAFVCFGV